MITMADAQSGKIQIGSNSWDLIRDHPANAHLKMLGTNDWALDTKGRKKWALVGFASSTRDLAPWDDPTWIVCGLNQLGRLIPRADVWHEVHAREIFLSDVVRDTNYLQWLQQCEIPLVMLERHADIPASIRFPLEEATKWMGRDYYQSSLAYMVLYAVLHGAEEIGIWGVDLVVGTEYESQRPNLEYILGLCEARGIQITLPEDTALLKQRYRYGPEITPPDAGPFNLKLFDERHAKMVETREKLLTQINGVEGHMAENRAMRDMLELYLRGAKVMP